MRRTRLLRISAYDPKRSSLPRQRCDVAPLKQADAAIATAEKILAEHNTKGDTDASRDGATDRTGPLANLGFGVGRPKRQRHDVVSSVHSHRGH
jgi:hypothetical protein